MVEWFNGVELWSMKLKLIVVTIVGTLLVGLAFTCWMQARKIQTQRDALIVASRELKNAANAIRSRDILIFSTAQSGGQSITKIEEKCLARIQEAYDAGLNAGSGGVQRTVRERQLGGAFAGSVPGGGVGGSSR